MTTLIALLGTSLPVYIIVGMLIVALIAIVPAFRSH